MGARRPPALLLLCLGSCAGSYLPVVQMHGTLDPAVDPITYGQRAGIIQQALPGVYVRNIQMSYTPGLEDTAKSVFMNINGQVEAFANIVRADPKLASGFDAIGYSQGCLILRAYIERHNDPPVRRFIAMHGPNMGAASLPLLCTARVGGLCKEIDYALGELLTEEVVQQNLAVAAFFRDPANLAEYRVKNIFLADINNERADGKFNAEYRERFASLETLVLVKALQDHVVVPRESEWFGFYKDGSDTELWTMVEAPWYLWDWFGLRTLHESGRVHFHTTPYGHGMIPNEILKSLVETYFK